MTRTSTHISITIQARMASILHSKDREWLNGSRNKICCLQEADFSYKDRHYLRVKGKTKVLQSNGIASLSEDLR